MTDGAYTLKDLELMCGKSTPAWVSIRYIVAGTHADRVALIEEAIHWIGQELTKNKQHKQDRGEDELTVDLINNLRSMGIDASHDTQYGGHCDIVIEAKDNFLWIGEAKIHSTYDWLLKGFDQLDTRYATGLFGQTYGALIIYSYNARIDQMMKTWETHLTSHRPDVTTRDCAKYPLALRSTHTHQVAGHLFNVWHFPISLYFNPQDR